MHLGQKQVLTLICINQHHCDLIFFFSWNSQRFPAQWLIKCRWQKEAWIHNEIIQRNKYVSLWHLSYRNPGTWLNWCLCKKKVCLQLSPYQRSFIFALTKLISLCWIHFTFPICYKMFPANFMVVWDSVFVKNKTTDSFLFAGKPVMIVTEYMENGSLDSFLRVSNCINTLTNRE